MKNHLLVVAIWALSLIVQANQEAEVLLESGIKACVPLAKAASPSVSIGSICFLSASDSNGEVFVYLNVAAAEEWELQDVQLQVTTSSTSLYFQVENRTHGDPISLDLSRESTLACPRDGVSFSTRVQAKVKRKQVEEAWKAWNSDKVEVYVPCTASNSTTTSRLRRRRAYQVVKPILQPCPPYPASSPFNLSKSFVLHANEAFELINMLSDEDLEDLLETRQDDYASIKGWEDYNDQVLVAKTRDTEICYAAFRGTEGFNVFDQFQNIVVLNDEIEGSDCVVRQGYKAAYFTSYYDQFRREVDSCVASCVNGCPLILAGYSQGGAVAVVASIDLRQYNPKVITWGAPRAIHVHRIPAFDIRRDPCTDANANNHYRFFNVQNGWYDRMGASPSFFNAKHIGHALVLDDDNYPIAGVGFNDDIDRIPWSDVPHSRELYFERMQAMMNRACYPVPIGKWPTAHFCSQNDECESQSACIDSRCEPQLPVAAPRAKLDVFP